MISRARSVLILTGVLAVAGGCTLEPRYRAPPLPVADHWESAGANAKPTDVADTGWRDVFPDATLQGLIETALANNRDLRIAIANVELARAQYRVQRSQSLPVVNADVAYSKSETPPVITGFPTALTTSYYTATIGTTAFELDLLGRVRSLNHAALEQYLSQAEVRRSAQLTVVAEVANAYLTLLADRELHRLAEATLSDQQKTFDLTQRRHDAGAVSGLDLAQAQTQVETAAADVAQYRGRVAQDFDALTLLVGTTLDPQLRAEAPAVTPAEGSAASAVAAGASANIAAAGVASGVFVRELAPGLPAQVLLRRPDVLSAEHTLRAANADIGAARAAFFPSISLTASAGSASNDLRGLFGRGTGTWTFAPQLNVPIFQYPSLKGQLDVANATRTRAVAQYEQSIQTAFKEVADGLALADTLHSQAEAQRRLENATAQALELSQQRYHAGRDSYLTVLDAQRSHYAAQLSLITTALAEQSNRINLYKALGGGWRERS